MNQWFQLDADGIGAGKANLVTIVTSVTLFNGVSIG